MPCNWNNSLSYDEFSHAASATEQIYSDKRIKKISPEVDQLINSSASLQLRVSMLTNIWHYNPSEHPRFCEIFIIGEYLKRDYSNIVVGYHDSTLDGLVLDIAENVPEEIYTKIQAKLFFVKKEPSHDGTEPDCSIPDSEQDDA